MPSFTFLLTIFFTHLLARLLLIFARRSASQLPPGPKPLPLIGNIHQLPRSLQWLNLYHWSKKYGPVMHLSMGGKPLIILSTHQAAQDLLINGTEIIGEAAAKLSSCIALHRKYWTVVLPGSKALSFASSAVKKGIS
ncbi:hypothetical protein BDV10DRAFT_189252 [Aspergillus recurvatus]